ncbi:translation initiation factor IF-2 subunit gamma [Candidatus Pacearchaeota archaeon]|nr:translation initiation factor IF-2 subunit gamma [Candidatus Pacearchaeota archaeon]
MKGKETGENKKIPTINVGIFGHIDHGKTTLLERLSGKWASTHSEELKRGITIKLGYADIIIYKDNNGYNTEKKGEIVRHVSFIDAPGHEMLMATTLSGAALIDAAILVVAANEGIKPQTYEHLMALQAKKVEKLIVVQNKIDLVTSEQAKKNYQDIKKFLGEHYRNVEIIPVSAQQRVNIDEVLRAIAEIPEPKRNFDKEPIFIVARSFDINKPGIKPKELHGVVLGGSLKQGKFRAGDEIEIKPGRAVKEKESAEKKYFPIKTRIVSLFNGSIKVNELTPGGSMSIETELDMSLGKGDLLSGNLVSLFGKLPEAVSEVKLKYNLFPRVFGISSHANVEPIKQKEILMLSINASITGGTINFVDKEHLTISLKVPTILFKGDNVGIARNVLGHWRLIGYGEIL